jgi:hypothetical protein
MRTNVKTGLALHRTPKWWSEIGKLSREESLVQGLATSAGNAVRRLPHSLKQFDGKDAQLLDQIQVIALSRTDLD